jgi:hypothetical protein
MSEERAMREAIAEFNVQGRGRLLKRYKFSRSSKFYLIHGQRLYDTKVLVAVAYISFTAPSKARRDIPADSRCARRVITGRLCGLPSAVFLWDMGSKTHSPNRSGQRKSDISKERCSTNTFTPFTLTPLETPNNPKFHR